jgi:hypothetical protein
VPFLELSKLASSDMILILGNKNCHYVS